MSNDAVVREQLLALLRGGNAHLNFEQAIAEFPLEHINGYPPNVSYTPWHLLEHMRMAQWDILEFVRKPTYVSPDWPEGYWPPPAEQADKARWQQTLNDFRADAQVFQTRVADPEVDLYAPLPHAQGYNVLRELLVVADHNAYHIGALAILRQVMGTWQARQ